MNVRTPEKQLSLGDGQENSDAQNIDSTWENMDDNALQASINTMRAQSDALSAQEEGIQQRMQVNETQDNEVDNTAGDGMDEWMSSLSVMIQQQNDQMAGLQQAKQVEEERALSGIGAMLAQLQSEIMFEQPTELG